MEQSSIEHSTHLGLKNNLSILGEKQNSLLESIFTNIGWKSKLLVIIAFLIFETILAQIKFFLPDNPVPVTMQTFGVLMMGSVLGWRLGLITIFSYVFLGIMGAPIFQSGNGGFSYFFGATGGYIVGFFLAVPIIGFLSQRGWIRSKALWAMLIGNIAIYIPAVIWLSIGMSFFDFSWPKSDQLLSQAVYPYIIGDLLKMVFAALITGLLWQVVDSRKLK
ncbi:MAG: biotin transporter BioY [Chloroflexi bacterium]|nr:biotin transporter BioY [Chloroflexota bacterium]|tara:strand:- start:42 stop:701 length:660 start_codon:yes stop_codon:yes gene_type:complete